MKLLTKRTRRAAAATATLALAGGLTLAAASPGAGAATAAPAHSQTAARTALPAGDSPTGWWYGTDSLPVAISGNPPYQVPRTGGAYGGYIGMTGS